MKQILYDMGPPTNARWPFQMPINVKSLTTPSNSQDTHFFLSHTQVFFHTFGGVGSGAKTGKWGNPYFALTLGVSQFLCDMFPLILPIMCNESLIHFLLDWMARKAREVTSCIHNQFGQINDQITFTSYLSIFLSTYRLHISDRRCLPEE